MENMVDPKALFSGVYAGKRVLVTGHTGFKGSWLYYWLNDLGAEVCGYALDVPYSPSHFSLLSGGKAAGKQFSPKQKSVIGDIRDFEKVKETILDFQPEIIFHLAAQPLVRYSYREPIETFSTNVIGSLNVYEAARACPSVKSIVSITTDKVYENNEWVWGYRENDRLGGKDPYSASKAAMEIMTSSYRQSYFNLENFGKNHSVLLAVARAGNVIGGGDWAEDRLIPDVVRSSLDKKTVIIRSPNSVRPWQHVLESISGYLMLGQKLIERNLKFADAFNFGPHPQDEYRVEQVVQTLKAHWPIISYQVDPPKEMPHEAGLLKLDCTKANQTLEWLPVWDVKKSLLTTISWYRAYYENALIKTQDDLANYVTDAYKQGAKWTR